MEMKSKKELNISIYREISKFHLGDETGRVYVDFSRVNTFIYARVHPQ